MKPIVKELRITKSKVENSKPQNTKGKDKVEPLSRLCITCRARRLRQDLIRLTVVRSGEVFVNHGPKLVCGRSAYLCKQEKCVEKALKTGRLRIALEGRKVKGRSERRLLSWPFEVQLINLINAQYTEPPKTCQNTENEEECE